MHYFEYASADATLYEGPVTQSQNTGMDEILEIRKDTNNNASIINVSRAVIKFDLSYISQSIHSGLIPSSSSDPKFYLNLYDANSSNLTTSQSLYGYAVSQSWTALEGKFYDDPKDTEGVSWRYRHGQTDTTQWVSGSNNTGGTWYTGSGAEASQSFEWETTDMRMDVTDIMWRWLHDTVPNEGFMVKRSGSVGNADDNVEEGNTTKYGHFAFFSRETDTVYQPKLEVVWNDSAWATGSLNPLVTADLEDLVVYMKGLRPDYKENSKVKFRLVGRERYPTKTYSSTTVSDSVTVKYLPSASCYYQIKDALTEDVMVPYGSGSYLSSDSSGNYFNLWLNGLQAERFYQIEYKVVSGSGVSQTVNYYGGDFKFKVSR
jgi:hypothetical protein